MGVAAYRAGKKQLEFDPRAERFTNSEDANRFLRPADRKGYEIPETA
jgi:hypothetical protein